jgi:hypothetical protein
MLTCAFGSPWGAKGCGPCEQCQAATAKAVREFWRNVFFGLYDADGYSAADRKAQAKRKATHAPIES